MEEATMKNVLKKWLWPILFTLGGMLIGLGYYYLAGCASGMCPITANPLRSMVYAGIMGWLISVILQRDPRKAAAHEE